MRLHRNALLALLISVLPLAAFPQAPDPFATLNFLAGTWAAKTTAPANVTAGGTYTFAFEMNHHILARHSTSDACKGNIDCDHRDLLYIYQDAPSAPLKAIYFDNEGHTIHYGVTTPTATSAIFLSDAGPGPRFRLTYELKDGAMQGKFQMQMPGQTDWHSYLEWAGIRQ